MRIAATLGLLGSALVHASAAADEPSAQVPARDRALDLFEQAERVYAAGDVERAVALLVEARALYPEPVLLYNLARAYETLGRLPDALDAYDRYLREAPDAPDRGAIVARIAAIRQQLAERARLERERSRTSADGGPGALPWVVASTGVAAIGAGVTFGLLAQGARGDAAADPIHASSVETFEQGQTWATVANVLFAAGGVLAAAGVTWIVVAAVSSDDDGEPVPRPSEPAVALGVGLGTVAFRLALR